MATEEDVTVERIPGYMGFIPGTRHIYGRSFGRVPPLKYLRETKSDSKDMEIEDTRPKNIWQVLLPPVRFIPGYTGHLPGKNYVFGKTFSQQVDECFSNLTKTRRAIEGRTVQLEETNRSSNQNRPERRAQSAKIDRSALQPKDLPDIKITDCLEPHMDQEISERPPITHDSVTPSHQPSINGENPTSRYDLVRNFESEKSMDRQKAIHVVNDYHQKSKEAEEEEVTHNPEEMFKDVQYKSPFGYKGQYSQGNSKYGSPGGHKVHFDPIHPVRNPSYDFENRNYDLANSCKIPDSILNHQRQDSLNNNTNEIGYSCCPNKDNNYANWEDKYKNEKNRVEPIKRYEDFSQETNHRHTNKTSPSSEVTSMIQQSKVNPATIESGIQNGDYNSLLNRTELPQTSTDKETLGLEPLQTPTNRLNAGGESHSTEERNLNHIHENVSWKYNKSIKPTMENLPRPNLYRKTYDDYNDSTRYFNNCLNPPITGYRGYIPRLNSSSALGLSFSSHLNSNLR